MSLSHFRECVACPAFLSVSVALVVIRFRVLKKQPASALGQGSVPSRGLVGFGPWFPGFSSGPSRSAWYHYHLWKNREQMTPRYFLALFKAEL